MTFNFDTRVAYTVEPKAAWHRAAKRQLRALAKALGLEPHQYDLRSNKAGIAVSGEVTLHTDTLYVQAAQSCIGGAHGLLVRTCKGRKDYTGGRNNTAPLHALNDPVDLAGFCRFVMRRDARFEHLLPPIDGL